MGILTKAIKSALQQQEDGLIGGILFTDTSNGQIMLFNKFGICSENNLSLKSDITNHYTEENYWINDHWAINPPQYTLTGFIGELIYTIPNGWADKIEGLFGKTGLGLLSVISPTLGSYTSGVLNIARKIESVVNKYADIAKRTLSLSKSIRKTNQRRVLDDLENLMNNRVLVNVYTPYGIYNNLAIISVNTRQSQDTKFVSNIEITFQKWRNPGDAFKSEYEEKQKSDVVAAQTAPAKEKGLVGTIKSNINLYKQNDLGNNFQVA